MTVRVSVYLALLSCAQIYGQVLINGVQPGDTGRLLPSDAAILELREPRKDLPCSVKPVAPELGFDLAFHSGYDVAVPFRELAGSGEALTAIFRATPQNRGGEPTYFSQKWIVPSLEEGGQGSAWLHGAFILGEGNYLIEWLLRDRAERYCSLSWEVSAKTQGKERLAALRLPAGTVQPEPKEKFEGGMPGTREGEHSLNVLLLLHIAPQASGAAEIQPAETAMLLSIVRHMAQEPRIGTYSVAAFNLDQNEIFYRRENVAQVDIPALGDVLDQLRFGTIDIKGLRRNDGGVQLLTGLLSEEMSKSNPDALIFVGPRTAPSARSINQRIKELAKPRCPVFYLSYAAEQDPAPWRDAIGSLVKFWKGFDYTIRKPRDLFMAWTEVMSRMSDREPVTAALERATLVGDRVTNK